MLPDFFYEPNRNKKKEQFVQEQLRIEMYIPEAVEIKEEDEKDDIDRGITIIQL